jgi:hypothetical protein
VREREKERERERKHPSLYDTPLPPPACRDIIHTDTDTDADTDTHTHTHTHTHTKIYPRLKRKGKQRRTLFHTQRDGRCRGGFVDKN